MVPPFFAGRRSGHSSGSNKPLPFNAGSAAPLLAFAFRSRLRRVTVGNPEQMRRTHSDGIFFAIFRLEILKYNESIPAISRLHLAKNLLAILRTSIYSAFPKSACTGLPPPPARCDGSLLRPVSIIAFGYSSGGPSERLEGPPFSSLIVYRTEYLSGPPGGRSSRRIP